MRGVLGGASKGSSFARRWKKLKRDARHYLDDFGGRCGHALVSAFQPSREPPGMRHVIVEKHPYMINPAGLPRMFWDFLVVMPVLLYLVVIMPYRIAFENDPKIYTPVYWFEFSIEMVRCARGERAPPHRLDAVCARESSSTSPTLPLPRFLATRARAQIFLADIVLNFRTGFFLGGIGDVDSAMSVEYHPMSCAKQYLSEWFALDVVSAIPFTLIDLLMAAGHIKAGGSDDASFLKLVKVLRLLRLLKLTRLFKVRAMTTGMNRDTVDLIEDFFQEGSTRSLLLLISLAGQLGYIVHIGACVWTAVGRAGSLAGVDCWLDYEIKGPFEAADTTTNESGSIYLAAFYYVLTTMTSVGYGDILPRNNLERSFSIALEFIGSFTFAMIIANLTSVVTSSDMNAKKTAEQLDAVSSFVANRQFPHTLGRRIRRHFRQFYNHKSAIDERKIFGEMSAALRKDVSVYIVKERMSDVKLFQTMNPKLWPRLFPILNPTTFEKGEFVCLQDEECSEMFIILEGSARGRTRLSDAGNLVAEAARKAHIAVDDFSDTATDPLAPTQEKRRGASGDGDSGGDDGDADGDAGGEAVRAPSRGGRGDCGRRGSPGLRNNSGHLGIGLEAKRRRSDGSGRARLVVTEENGTKIRHIGAGDSINVLSVLKVWDKCVETVVAETRVESYAVSSDEFYALFNHDNEIDQQTFEQMRAQEVSSFRMDTSQPAPTQFGVPLYMTFSCVSCTVVMAKGLMAADRSLMGVGTSDPCVAHHTHTRAHFTPRMIRSKRAHACFWMFLILFYFLSPPQVPRPNIGNEMAIPARPLPVCCLCR